jgi:hypothetical protein
MYRRPQIFVPSRASKNSGPALIMHGGREGRRPPLLPPPAWAEHRGRELHGHRDPHGGWGEPMTTNWTKSTSWSLGAWWCWSTKTAGTVASSRAGTPRLHTVVVMVSFRLQVCRMFRNECEYSGSMLAGRNIRCSGTGRYSAIQNESSLIVQFVSYFEQNRRGVQSWWSSCRARLSPWNIDLTISISLITKYLYH